MAPFRVVMIWLFIFLQSSVRLIEAVAAVNFQFLKSYASVQSSIEEFTSQLTVDFRTKYSFTSQHIRSIQVTPSPSDRIQVNFDLDIDTRNRTLISQRDRLENDLLAPNYIFLFTNSTGARETFLVDSESVSVTPSFEDGWHQIAPDIFYAILVGLVLFAMFCVAAYFLVSKQKRLKKKNSSNRENGMPPSAGHLNGIDNEGYVTEMTQVYRIKNTEASPIPHRLSRSIETSFSVIEPSSTESTEPQSPKLLQIPQPPSHLQRQTDSPILEDIPLPSSPMYLQEPTEPQSPSLDQIPQSSSPGQPRRGDRPELRRSVTTSESPTLNDFMPPSSSHSLVRKIVSMYDSVRTTPRSSISKQPPSSSSPRQSQQIDQTPLRIAVTPSVSHTHSEKPPTSPNLTPKVVSLQGSVRSSILGVSTTTTPASSRRTSIIGPSIYARLLYASYSVPPKRVYNYI